MPRAKAVLRRLLHPPGWALGIGSVVSFAALWFVFAAGLEKSAGAYPVFVLAAYALFLLCMALPAMLRRIRQWKVKFFRLRLMQRLAATAVGKRYLSDRLFRGTVSIYQGMTVNFLYMGFRAVTGMQYHSIWFLSIAVYYLVLCLMRAYLAFGYHKSAGQIRELAYYRQTAKLLFVLNIPMGGMIFLMVQTNSGFTYPGHVIYLSALHTFYMIILAARNLMKFRNLGSPILAAARVLNFVSAMMSVLGLQTAMIAQFSSGEGEFRMQMNAITGAVVFGAVIVIAIGMLVHSTGEKEEVEANEPGTK